MTKEITVTEFKKFLNYFEDNMTVLEIRQLLSKYNMEDESISNAKFIERCKEPKPYTKKGLWIDY